MEVQTKGGWAEKGLVWLHLICHKKLRCRRAARLRAPPASIKLFLLSNGKMFLSQSAKCICPKLQNVFVSLKSWAVLRQRARPALLSAPICTWWTLWRKGSLTTAVSWGTKGLSNYLKYPSLNSRFQNVVTSKNILLSSNHCCCWYLHDMHNFTTAVTNAPQIVGSNTRQREFENCFTSQRIYLRQSQCNVWWERNPEWAKNPFIF